MKPDPKALFEELKRIAKRELEQMPDEEFAQLFAPGSVLPDDDRPFLHVAQVLQATGEYPSSAYADPHDPRLSEWSSHPGETGVTFEEPAGQSAQWSNIGKEGIQSFTPKDADEPLSPPIRPSTDDVEGAGQTALFFYARPAYFARSIPEPPFE